jgi:hypothetical protein
VSPWCLGDVLVISRCRLEGVCMALCSFDGVSVCVVPRWRLGGVSTVPMLIQGVRGVLVGRILVSSCWWMLVVSTRLGTRFRGGFRPHLGIRFPSILTSTFTRKSCFCREMFLHISVFSQGGAFTQRWFNTERLFYKRMLLHAGALTRTCVQRRDVFTHRCFR